MNLRKYFMIIHILGIVLLLFSIPCLLSQPKNVPVDRYYVGNAEGEDLQKVREDALNNLIQKIQMFVRSEYKRYKEETTTGYTDSTVAHVIARSSMKLSDVEENIEYPKTGYCRVTKYVSRKMVDQMFEIRRQKILEHLDIAGNELGKAKNVGTVNIESVLSNYYKAFLLLFTLRDHDTLSYVFKIDEPPQVRISKDLIAGIPNALENIINGIHVRPVKRIEDPNSVWKFTVDYKGIPISNMQYSFYDGAGNTYADVRNGEIIMTFFFPPNEKREREIDFKIEYQDEEGLDELLQLAKTISAKQKLAENVTFKFPSDAIPPKDTCTLIQRGEISASIQELIVVHESWDKTLPVLMELNRRNRIIIGKKENFDSLEGLYALIVSANGSVTILKSKKNRLIDIVICKEVSIDEFSGRPIYWIEALK